MDEKLAAAMALVEKLDAQTREAISHTHNHARMANFMGAVMTAVTDLHDALAEMIEFQEKVSAAAAVPAEAQRTRGKKKSDAEDNMPDEPIAQKRSRGNEAP